MLVPTTTPSNVGCLKPFWDGELQESCEDVGNSGSSGNSDTGQTHFELFSKGIMVVIVLNVGLLDSCIACSAEPAASSECPSVPHPIPPNAATKTPCTHAQVVQHIPAARSSTPHTQGAAESHGHSDAVLAIDCDAKSGLMATGGHEKYPTIRIWSNGIEAFEDQGPDSDRGDGATMPDLDLADERSRDGAVPGADSAMVE